MACSEKGTDSTSDANVKNSSTSITTLHSGPVAEYPAEKVNAILRLECQCSFRFTSMAGLSSTCAAIMYLWSCNWCNWCLAAPVYLAKPCG